MKITNTDENGRYHGEQKDYYANGNIGFIANYHHDKRHGYEAWFYSDKTIMYKEYWNMGNRIYVEGHLWSKQIEITI